MAQLEHIHPISIGGGGCLWSEQELETKQTRDIEPLLDRCWPSFVDAGPTLKPTMIQCVVSRDLLIRPLNCGRYYILWESQKDEIIFLTSLHSTFSAIILVYFLRLTYYIAIYPLVWIILIIAIHIHYNNPVTKAYTTGKHINNTNNRNK